MASLATFLTSSARTFATCGVLQVRGLIDRSDEVRTADGYIVSRCLNGDSAAFGLLVDKYRAGVYALAYSKLHNFHDAEDVAQEAFAKAYGKLATLKRYDSFHAWLYSITSNLCKDWIRKQSRRPDSHFIADQDRKTLEGASMDSYREELVRESIHQALNSMPEKYQQVLSLYYLGGMNSREIAEFLAISPNAVRHRLIKARSQLREEVFAMISTTLEEHRLPASFTFRMVEMARRIKINSTPRTSGLPWGLTVAAAAIIAVLGLNPRLGPSNAASSSVNSLRPAAANILETGEIPVNVFLFSQVPMFASQQGNADNTESGSPESRTDAASERNASSEKSILTDPKTGLKFRKIFSDEKLGVIMNWSWLTSSPDGSMLFTPWEEEHWVVPLKEGAEPFRLTAQFLGEGMFGQWSPDLSRFAFVIASTGDLWIIPVSPETCRPTGSPERIFEQPGEGGRREGYCFPSWSPDGEKLAFMSKKSGNLDIWIIPATGGAPVQLTHNPNPERFPNWSPDGKVIAFNRRREAPPAEQACGDIWIIPALGGVAERIIENVDEFSRAVWSPDGKYIRFRLYRCRRGEEDSGYRIFRLSDRREFRVMGELPDGISSGYAWSKDSRNILFFSSGYDYESALRVVPAYGGPWVELGNFLELFPYAQGWSPDGKVIVTVNSGDSELWVIPTTGGTPVKIGVEKDTRFLDDHPLSPDLKKFAFIGEEDSSLWVAPISVEDAKMTGPAIKIADQIMRRRAFFPAYFASWCPDSKRIAFCSTKSGNVDIWVASADGKERIQITDDPEEESSDVSWSPDGRTLAYRSKGGIWLIPSSGGVAQQIARGAIEPSWSPDGKELGFIGESHISIITLKTGVVRNLIDLKSHGLDANPWGLSWSPDGRNLAFISYKERYRIWVIPAEGGKLIELAKNDLGDKYYFSWSPDGKRLSYSSDRYARVRTGSIWAADVSELLSSQEREQ